jgi:hypothetical protein
MHSNATDRGRASILKHPNRLNVRSGSVAGPPPNTTETGNATPNKSLAWPSPRGPF